MPGGTQHFVLVVAVEGVVFRAAEELVVVRAQRADVSRRYPRPKRIVAPRPVQLVAAAPPRQRITQHD